MTKSDWSLPLWLLSECSLSILWVTSECSLNACLMLFDSSWSHPEVFMDSSWSHHEEFEAERWRLSALDKLVPNGQTDRRTEWHPELLSEPINKIIIPFTHSHTFPNKQELPKHPQARGRGNLLTIGNCHFENHSSSRWESYYILQNHEWSVQ